MGFLVFLLLPFAALGAPLFEGREPLALEIKTDYKSLLSLPGEEEKPFPATLTLGASSFTAQIQPRGRMRREQCPQLPPLKLILPKGKAKRLPPFLGLDRDLKIVTNCYPKLTEEKTRFALKREFLQYKLLNAADFPSFRVRLAEITYRDNSGEILSQSPAFFIENIKDFKKRQGLNEDAPAPDSLDLIAELVVAESFLENYDYFVPSMGAKEFHNVSAVVNQKGEFLAMVPFDFDLSLISRSGEMPEIPKILEGFKYLGPPGAHAQVRKQLQRLAGKKQALLAEIEKSPLPDTDKATLTKWVEDYTDAAKIFTGAQP